MLVLLGSPVLSCSCWRLFRTRNHQVLHSEFQLQFWCLGSLADERLFRLRISNALLNPLFGCPLEEDLALTTSKFIAMDFTAATKVG